MQCWGHQQPVYIDLWHLDPTIRTEDQKHPLLGVSEFAQARGIQIVPVIGLDAARTPNYQDAVRRIANHNGVCFRLLPSTIVDRDFTSRINNLVSYLQITPSKIDLLVDYQLVTDKSHYNMQAISMGAPNIEQWRSFTIVSGAFPKDLSDLPKNNEYTIERNDWLMWREQVQNWPQGLRIPQFGDYTIQHPLYSELEGIPDTSASIRYTSEDYWVIMRGESLRTGSAKHQQYIAQAMLLCERSEYCGSTFSYGDKYIKERSLEFSKNVAKPKTGNPMTWLRAGINHHMTFVLTQLSSLPGF